MARRIAAIKNIRTGRPAFLRSFMLAEKPTVVKNAIIKISLIESSKIKEKLPVSCPNKIKKENKVPPVTASGIQLFLRNLNLLFKNFPR